MSYEHYAHQQVNINIEICAKCTSHQWFTHHNPQKYETQYHYLKKEIVKQLPQANITRNQAPASYKQIETSPHENLYINNETGQELYFPRIGAFEIYLNESIVFSKLRSGCWPNIPAVVEYIKTLLQRRKSDTQAAEASPLQSPYETQDTAQSFSQRVPRYQQATGAAVKVVSFRRNVLRRQEDDHTQENLAAPQADLFAQTARSNFNSSSPSNSKYQQVNQSQNQRWPYALKPLSNLRNVPFTKNLPKFSPIQANTKDEFYNKYHQFPTVFGARSQSPQATQRNVQILKTIEKSNTVTRKLAQNIGAEAGSSNSTVKTVKMVANKNTKEDQDTANSSTERQGGRAVVATKKFGVKDQSPQSFRIGEAKYNANTSTNGANKEKAQTAMPSDKKSKALDQQKYQKIQVSKQNGGSHKNRKHSSQENKDLDETNSFKQQQANKSSEEEYAEQQDQQDENVQNQDDNYENEQENFENEQADLSPIDNMPEDKDHEDSVQNNDYEEDFDNEPNYDEQNQSKDNPDKRKKDGSISNESRTSEQNTDDQNRPRSPLKGSKEQKKSQFYQQELTRKSQTTIEDQVHQNQMDKIIEPNLQDNSQTKSSKDVNNKSSVIWVLAAKQVKENKIQMTKSNLQQARGRMSLTMSYDRSDLTVLQKQMIGNTREEESPNDLHMKQQLNKKENLDASSERQVVQNEECNVVDEEQEYDEQEKSYGSERYEDQSPKEDKIVNRISHSDAKHIAMDYIYQLNNSVLIQQKYVNKKQITEEQEYSEEFDEQD